MDNELIDILYTARETKYCDPPEYFPISDSVFIIIFWINTFRLDILFIVPFLYYQRVFKDNWLIRIWQPDDRHFARDI